MANVGNTPSSGGTWWEASRPQAGVQQLRKKPSKYGAGLTGFGKRLGASFAANAVNKTVEHAVAAKLHEDLDYHRAPLRHAWGIGVRPRSATSRASRLWKQTAGSVWT